VTVGHGVVGGRAVIPAVAGERGHRSRDLVEQGAGLGAVVDPSAVSEAATICPVPTSMPKCSFRHDRRVRVPCLSTSHSPGPHSCSLVLPTSRRGGSALP